MGYGENTLKLFNLIDHFFKKKSKARKFAVSIISPPDYIHSQAFFEIAETIHYGLLELGYDSIITSEANIVERQHIILGSNLLPHCSIEIAEDAIIYNLEQVEIGSTWFGPELIDILRKYTIWDYSEQNVLALGAIGIKVDRVVPIGYVEQLTKFQLAQEEDRNIDVLFIGSWSAGREKIINEMISLGLRVEVVCGVYGVERDEIISRAKLVLNMHLYNARILEMVRISYLLANRCSVISERSSEPSVDEEMEEGVAFADYDQLASRAVELIGNPRERQRLSERGFEIIRERSAVNYLASALR
jgi:hypothetical protein